MRSKSSAKTKSSSWRKIFSARSIRNTPAWRRSRGLGNHLISGSIQVLNFSYFQTDFPDTFRTAVEIRNEIQERGWKTIVAFQTRNPMHRAHEELCRMAQERLNADGIVIHMLLGKLKEGDIPAPVRDACIRKMAELYFPPNTVMITGYGFDMLYAGPREAVLHAIFRQNMGATHFILGRDHAGVGDYYGPFDAQTIFDEKVPQGALLIELFRADNTAYLEETQSRGDDARSAGSYARRLHQSVGHQSAADAGFGHGATAGILAP